MGSFPNQRTSHSGFVPLGGSLGFMALSIIFFLKKTIIFFNINPYGFSRWFEKSELLRLVIQIIIGMIF